MGSEGPVGSVGPASFERALGSHLLTGRRDIRQDAAELRLVQSEDEHGQVGGLGLVGPGGLGMVGPGWVGLGLVSAAQLSSTRLGCVPGKDVGGLRVGPHSR